jgi:hypothetical protein
MTKTITLRKRYMTDPKYHYVVNMLVSILEQGLLTTADVAESAVLAAQIYAERHCTPTMIRIEYGCKRNSR